MKVAFTADLHGNLPEVPECDLLVIAGDVCPVYDHSSTFQRDWLTRSFAPWLQSFDAGVVGVAGNHDFIAEEDPDFMDSLPWLYIKDEDVNVAGLCIYGSPYSNQFGRWAFMEPEDELQYRWQDIPGGLDILITHGPPYGIGDYVNNDWGDAARDKHVGSKSLTSQVRKKTPRVHVFGHIHEGAGDYTGLAGTRSINASLVNEFYEVVNPIRVLEL